MSEKEPSKKKKPVRKKKKSDWDKLTPKQKKFVKEYLETGCGAEAARRAGYAPNRARTTAAETVAKSSVQNAMAELLDKAGLTDDAIAKKLQEGAEALETKFFAKDGIVVQKEDVIAWDTRLRYLDTALKLKGKYPAKKISLTALTEDELLEIARQRFRPGGSPGTTPPGTDPDHEEGVEPTQPDFGPE
jgi:hypothetical protein